MGGIYADPNNAAAPATVKGPRGRWRNTYDVKKSYLSPVPFGLALTGRKRLILTQELRNDLRSGWPVCWYLNALIKG